MDEKQQRMNKTLDKLHNPLQNCNFFYPKLSQNQSKWQKEGHS